MTFDAWPLEWSVDEIEEAEARLEDERDEWLDHLHDEAPEVEPWEEE